jgi:hypothetical protein
LLDLALLAVAGFLGWQIRQEWLASHARTLALLQSSLPKVITVGLPPLDKIDPTSAATYLEIASKNLFSPDRNPNVIIEVKQPAPEPPPPPFPVAHGVMLWDGVPPTIVLSEKANGAQRGYHPGDTIGQWKLVALDNSYVNFEWDGKEFKKRIDELIDRTPVPVVAAPASNTPAAPAAKPAGPTSLSSGQKAGPGIDLGGGQKGCVAGDSDPDGTVMEGMKKVVVATPFGNNCHWEPVGK